MSSETRGTITKSILSGIADEIRAKLGVETQYKPTQMANAIASIPTATLQSKTVTPSASQQTVQPDSGYDGLSSVVINGDADLVAGNIKKDVEIFGVTGSYEGSGGGGRTLVAEWDFTGSDPLTDKVGNKTLTNFNNRITFSNAGAYLPANFGSSGDGYSKSSLYIPLASLFGFSVPLYGFDVEVDVGAWGKTRELTDNYHCRFILVSTNAGLTYRQQINGNQGWGFYSNSWSQLAKSYSDIVNKTVKVSVCWYDKQHDTFYIDGAQKVVSNVPSIASYATMIAIGCPDDEYISIGDIYITSMRVYAR